MDDEEYNALWSSREEHIVKLFKSINLELVPENWKISDPQRLSSSINFYEFIENQKKLIDEHLFRDAAMNLLHSSAFMSVQIVDIVKLRIEEPLRQLIEMLRDDKKRFKRHQKEIKKLEEEKSLLMKKLEEKRKVTQESEIEQHPHKEMSESEIYKDELNQKLIAKGLDSVHHINNWARAVKINIRDKKDEWKRAIIDEVKKEWNHKLTQKK